MVSQRGADLRAIVLLDMDGKRILGQHTSIQTNDPTFERRLFIKTKGTRIKEECFSLDGLLVLHKFFADFHLYVIGAAHANPMHLESVTSCLVDLMRMLTSKSQLELSVIETHKARLLLAMDQICDSGLTLETDANLVHARIGLKADGSEPSMVRKLQTASELIKFPWSKS